MAEQQLIDYITKAKDAGQPDDQTRSLLYKNGWTVAEVDDAFTVISQVQSQLEPKPQVQPQIQAQPQVQAQPQPQIQPQVISQPIVDIQPQVESQLQPQIQAQPQVQSQPQTQPQSSVATTQYDTTRIRGNSHAVMKILVVLMVLIIVCGAGYLFAGQYFNLSWNPFAPKPETVINKMLNSMAGANSYHTVAQIEIDAIDNASKVSQGKISLNSDGEIDTSDIANTKSDGSYVFNLIEAGTTAPIASANVSAVSVGGAFYLKINSITLPNTFSYPGLNISQINGKWFKIDQNSYNMISQATGEQLTSAAILQANSQGLTKKMWELAAAENMFSVNKQLGDEVVSGQDTYHYSVTISRAKLKDLMTKIIASEAPATTQTQNSPTDNSGIAVENTMQSVEQSYVSGVVGAIGDVNMEIWIGKKDNMLYEYKIDKVVDLSSALDVPSSLELKVNSINSNFNKSISVQEPQGAQKIENIVGPLLANQKVNSDMVQIGSQADSLFATNNNYNLVCKNGFLNGSKTTPYGLVFVSVANDLLKKQGAKNPVCFAGAQDYCVSTQLSNGSYLCIGKNGTLGAAQCVSAQTVCQ